VFYKIYTIRNY